MARFTNSPQSVKSYERLFEISNFDTSKYNDPFLEIAKLLIQNTSFDTIYHEHVHYYGVKPLVQFLIPAQCLKRIAHMRSVLNIMFL